MSRENGWPVVYEASDGRVPVDDVPVINVADVEHVQVVGPSIFIEKPGPLGCWSVVVRSKPRGCSHVSTVTVVTTWTCRVSYAAVVGIPATPTA